MHHRWIIFIPHSISTGVCVFVCVYFKTWFLCVYVCICHMCALMHGIQRKVSGSSELDLVMSQPCGCWDLNSGPLEEQQTLLTAKPFLQAGPHIMTFENVKSTHSPVNRYLVLISSKAGNHSFHFSVCSLPKQFSLIFFNIVFENREYTNT